MRVINYFLFLCCFLETFVKSESEIQMFDAKYNITNFRNNVTIIIERFKKLWPVWEWKEYGFFNDEYISYINVHWLQFLPPHESSYFILGVIYMVIISFGFTGNFIVILMFIRCRSLRTPANTLILNLAISDGIINLKIPIFIYNCFHKGPALGDIACRIYGFVGGLSGTVSIITLSAISFDRYFVIKYPLRRVYSHLRIKLCLIVTWAYGVVFAIIPALDIGLGRYTYEGYLTSCSYDYLTSNMYEKIFIFVFFIAAWVFPFALIIFSYSNIFKVVTTRSIRSISKKMGRDSSINLKEKDSRKQEIKLTLVVFCTICLWFISWTPYAIISLLGIFNQRHLITPLSSMIPALFCKTTSCINPFVYAFSHPKFAQELKNMFCRRIHRTRENHRVWTSNKRKSQRQFESYDNNSDIEEEFVEIELKSTPTQLFQRTEVQTRRDRVLKRHTSMLEMLCLRPNFSNRSTGLRSLARRWSTKEREREQSKY